MGEIMDGCRQVTLVDCHSNSPANLIHMGDFSCPAFQVDSELSLADETGRDSMVYLYSFIC